MPLTPASRRDTSRRDTSRGALLLVGAALSFSVMSVLVKLGGRTGLPAQEMVFGRALVTLALSLIELRLRGIGLFGHRRGVLLLRGLLGFGALSAFFYAVTRLPLAEITVIHFLNPLLAALLAAVLLGEPVRRLHAVGIALSIGGVVLVTRPAVLFGGGAAGLDPAGIAAAFAAAILASGAYVAVRYLSRTEDPLVIVFYFALVAVPAAVPLVAPVFVWPRGVQWPLLLGIGVVTQAGQLLLTRGLARVPTGPGTAIGYVQILFAAGWGLLLFGERPSGWTLAGALAVVSGVLVVVLGASDRSAAS